MHLTVQFEALHPTCDEARVFQG